MKNALLGRGAAALLAACVLASAAACTHEPADSEPSPQSYLSGVVYIAVNSDLPGWSEYSNGVWDGFDIALGNWLGRELGFTPRYVPVTTNEREGVLEPGNAGTTSSPNNGGPNNDGQIKLVIANFSITDARRRNIDFAGPYLTDAQGLMTLTGSAIAKREDIENRTICTALGSTDEKRLFDMKIVPLSENTLQRCVDRMRAGQVDGISSDRVLLDGFVAHDPGGDLLVTPGIRVGSERYGIGMPNNRPKLCALISDKLSKFIDEQWDQVFRDKLPGVSPRDRKPNSGQLDSCEKADKDK